MTPRLTLVFFFAGTIGLAVTAVAASGTGPEWFTKLDTAIASVSGVLIGGALGPMLDGTFLVMNNQR